MCAIREVYPYLCVRGAAAAIEFYQKVFGAEEIFRMTDPGNGRIGHAELKLGPVTLMLTDEHPELGIRSPLAFGGSGTTIHLHVDDVDALAKRAVQAGATMLREPADYSHGERQCRLRDPFGHIRPAFRGEGLGKLALAEVRAACAERGLRALHLEVGRDNAAAQSLYHRAGFVDTDRQLLTLKLADPTHLP